MSQPETELLLRVNGIQAAFGIEFGFASARADEGRKDPYRQANVSFSLVQRRKGEIVRHTLIDAGMGIVPSLLDFERSHDVHVVHEVFLSHPHLDHFAQLDWLSMCLHRNLRTSQPRPLPVYCSPACWDFEAGPRHVLRGMGDRVQHRPIRHAEDVILGDVRITPFAVDHGPRAPGAHGFIVRHGTRRIVLTCDFVRVPDEDDPLLFDADVCFLDANTWHHADWTNHSSALGCLGLVRKWRPKRAYLLHYSGYEDRTHSGDAIDGPLSLERLTSELRRASEGRDVQPARHGMILGDDTPWPG